MTEGETLGIEHGFAGVIISPHARFTAGYGSSFGNMIPAVGAVIDRMEDKPFVVRILIQIGFSEKGLQYGQPRLFIGVSFGFALSFQPASEAQQALAGDAGRGAVDRFVQVEGIGGTILPVGYQMQIRGPGIPVGYAVAARVDDVVIRSGPCCFDEGIFDACSAAEGFQIFIGNRFEEFQLFGEPGNDPGEAAGPGAEGAVALLRVRAAVASIVGVEDTFVCHASPLIVHVPTGAVIDIPAGGGQGVLQETIE